MERKISDMISYVFGKYDMRKGERNKRRMECLLKFCMEDIRQNPELEKFLDTHEKLEHFVIQSIIYMMHDEGKNDMSDYVNRKTQKNSESTVVYDKMMSPQNYLELITGKYFLVRADNQLEEIERILQSEGYNDLWNYPLDEIDEVMANEGRVVLVEIVNINDDGEMDYIYRWFEVPDTIARENIIKNE